MNLARNIFTTLSARVIVLGIALVFFPAQQITSVWLYEVWMFGGTLAFIGLAGFFFFVYGRRKAPQEVATRA